MSFDALDLDKVLLDVKKATLSSRRILLDYFGQLTQVSEKYQAGLVTEADLASEKNILNKLQAKYPDFDFLGEEEHFQREGSPTNKEFIGRWIVDPLDGTTNYVHRLPFFCISIGLEYRGEIVLGVIDVPKLDLTYSAIKGRGAFVNKTPLKVSSTQRLQDSLLATGFFSEKKEALAEQLKVFSEFIKQVRGIRRIGSAAYDLCLVAEGVFDGYWEKNLSPWDTAAGSLLVKEAGGQVTNYKGDLFHPDMKSIIASNKTIHKDLQSKISQILK